MMKRNFNYEKAKAEVIYFTNQDIITSSGGCKNNGQDNGNGCSNNNSSACRDQAWK